MDSDERDRLPNGDVRVHRDVDWAKYGLRDPEETQENAKNDSGDGNNALGPEMYQAGANELFAQEYVRNICDQSNADSLYSITLQRSCVFPTEFGSLVEIELLHLPTGVVRHLGRGLYVLPY